MRPAMLALALLAMAASCAVEQQRPDWNSGGDHKRDLAKLAPLGRAVTDSVSDKKGDHTDWRYISVPKKGRIEIKVSVDNPSALASLTFSDSLGQPLARHRLNGKDMVYAFEEDVESGKYFVQVQTSKYETVYTIKSAFEGEPEPEPAYVEPAAAAEPKARRRGRRRRKKAEPKPAAEEEATPGTVVIVGKVLNKIPWDEGKKTRITFNKGDVHGVKAGATAVISNGPTMKVKQVFEEASVGFAKVKPATIKEGTKVVITVRN